MPLDPPKNLRLPFGVHLRNRSVSVLHPHQMLYAFFVCKYKWTETTAHGAGVVCDLSIIISEHERSWKGRSYRLIFFATNT